MDKKWLKSKLLERGRGSQRELAKVLGIDVTVVNKLVNTPRKVTDEEGTKIRNWIAGWDRPEGTPSPTVAPEPEPERPLPQTNMTPAPTPPGRPDVPVWASAEAGSDGAMVLVNEPIDWIHRSERMRGVQKPFAFYVIGSSMSPSIEHGDQVVVNPSLLPTVGKDHVFLQTQEDGTILALVKRLLRIGSTAWKVRQFNPPKDYDLPKSKWSKAHVVSEKKVGGV